MVPQKKIKCNRGYYFFSSHVTRKYISLSAKSFSSSLSLSSSPYSSLSISSSPSSIDYIPIFIIFLLPLTIIIPRIWKSNSFTSFITHCRFLESSLLLLLSPNRRVSFAIFEAISSLVGVLGEIFILLFTWMSREGFIHFDDYGT